MATLPTNNSRRRSSVDIIGTMNSRGGLKFGIQFEEFTMLVTLEENQTLPNVIDDFLKKNKLPYKSNKLYLKYNNDYFSPVCDVDRNDILLGQLYILVEDPYVKAERIATMLSKGKLSDKSNVAELKSLQTSLKSSDEIKFVEQFFEKRGLQLLVTKFCQEEACLSREILLLLLKCVYYILASETLTVVVSDLEEMDLFILTLISKQMQELKNAILYKYTLFILIQLIKLSSKDVVNDIFQSRCILIDDLIAIFQKNEDDFVCCQLISIHLVNSILTALPDDSKFKFVELIRNSSVGGNISKSYSKFQSIKRIKEIPSTVEIFNSYVVHILFYYKKRLDTIYSEEMHEELLKRLLSNCEDQHKQYGAEEIRLLQQPKIGSFPLLLLEYYLQKHPDKYKEANVKHIPMIESAVRVCSLLADNILDLNHLDETRQNPFFELLFEEDNPFESLFCVVFNRYVKTFCEMEANCTDDVDQVIKYVIEQVNYAKNICGRPVLEEFSIVLRKLNLDAVQRKIKQHLERNVLFNTKTQGYLSLKEKKEGNIKQMIYKERIGHLHDGAEFHKVEKGTKGKEILNTHIKLNKDKKTLRVSENVRGSIVSYVKFNAVSSGSGIYTNYRLSSISFEFKAKEKQIIIKNLSDNKEILKVTTNNSTTFNCWMDAIAILQGKEPTSDLYREQLEKFVNLELEIQLIEMDNIKIPEECIDFPPIPSELLKMDSTLL